MQQAALEGGAAKASIDRIARAVGDVPRVAYEAAHVYPLSAPSFTPCEQAVRPIAGTDPIKLYVHVPFCLALTATGRLVYDLVTFQFYPERQRRWLAERQRLSDGRSAHADALANTPIPLAATP